MYRLNSFILIFAYSGCAAQNPPVPERTSTCETRYMLVDHQKWRIVSPSPPDGGTNVPFGDAGVAAGADSGMYFNGWCPPTEGRYELFAQEPSYAFYTAICGKITVEQAALESIEAGDKVTVRVWYYSQFTNYQMNAQLAVSALDAPLWSNTVKLPNPTGGLINETITINRAIPVGTALRWDLTNHGANSWHLIELSVTKRHACP